MDSNLLWFRDFFRRFPKLRAYEKIKVVEKSGSGEARQSGDQIWIFPKFWKLPESVRDFVFAHEIGHYVLSKIGSKKFMDFAKAAGIDPWDTPALPWGQFNWDEAFADTFAVIFTDPAEQRYPEWQSLLKSLLGKRPILG